MTLHSLHYSATVAYVSAGGTEPWAWAIEVLLKELREETDGPPQARIIYIYIYISLYIYIYIIYICIYIYIWAWAVEVLLKELREETDGPPQVCIYVYV